MPRRGEPPGLKYSHTDMLQRHSRMKMKNAAVGQVHAIQVSIDVFSMTWFSAYTRPRAKPLAM